MLSAYFLSETMFNCDGILGKDDVLWPMRQRLSHVLCWL